MPETQPQTVELTAADIRRLLNDQFPPQKDADGKTLNTRENILAAIVLGLADNIEALEKVIVKLAENQQQMEAKATALGRIVGAVAKAAKVDVNAVLAAVGVQGAQATATTAADEE